MQRHAATFIIIVAIAVVANIAVAYLCAKFAKGPFVGIPPRAAILQSVPVPPGTPMATSDVAERFVQPAVIRWGLTSPMYEWWRWRAVGFEASTYAATAYDAWNGPRVTCVRTGWPLHCLEGATAMERKTYPAKLTSRSPPMARWAATTPRWREMILNVAIFAAAIWVLKVVAIQSMRLSVRIAKRWLFYSPGLCKACGYDLRGTMHKRCPECGAAESR